MDRKFIQPPELDNPGRRAFSHGIKVGNFLFIAGQLGTNKAGKIVEPGDTAAQARRIFGRMKAILRQTGGKLSDIVSVVVYFKEIRDFDAFCDVRRELFVKDFPTSTAIQVSNFVAPDALIEISAVAVLRDS